MARWFDGELKCVSCKENRIIPTFKAGFESPVNLISLADTESQVEVKALLFTCRMGRGDKSTVMRTLNQL